ncbi:MAG: transposase [Candidatus Thermoplasmatota archaeon]|nr:transposase [Candidatus Thermoplasmatota archaeon]
MLRFDPFDFFRHPKTPRQRQYDALREYYLTDLTQKEIAAKHGYAVSTFQTLVRDFKKQKIMFFPPVKKGPKDSRMAPSLKDKIVYYRKQNYSIYEIQDTLFNEGYSWSLDSINRVLREEGFAKLPRRTSAELGLTKKKTSIPPKAMRLHFDDLSDYSFDCQVGGIFYFIPYMLQMGLYDLINGSSFPETGDLSKVNSVFSILALKLIGHERLSKINSYNFDTGFGFFAGLTVPPKSTATSTYSYRIDQDMINEFMHRYIVKMNTLYPGYYSGETINLDFHNIPHYGERSKMEKNWVGSKHQSMKSALTFFAQDGDSRHLLYVNTDIMKDESSKEIMHFVEYWTGIKGVIDQTLVFDSKLTTYDNLERLNDDHIKFITLRRRGKNLIEEANTLSENEWINVDLKKKKRAHNAFKMYERDIVLPRTELKVRQVIFKDHGRQQPTFLITNNYDFELEELALLYANRWLIENKLSELIDFFKLNALSSPFMIRICFDVLLTLVADTLYRLLSQDLKRYEVSTPKTIFQDFINGGCKGKVKDDRIIIQMKKKATTPIFKSCEVFKQSYEVPWFGGKKLYYEWIS